MSHDDKGAPENGVDPAVSQEAAAGDGIAGAGVSTQMSGDGGAGPEGTATRSGESISFEQTATWGGVFPIAALNALLNIVTLTLWRFWGRTRVRRYMWSTTLINGTPLTYTGSGAELFRSFIFVMLLIFLPIYGGIFALQLYLPPEQAMMILGLAYIPILFAFSWLMGMAIWIARRYRLSRTTWRGIRFGQAGSANAFSWASIGYGFLVAVTMGWFEPVKEMRLSRRLWGETFFGDKNFDITQSDEGLAGPLYPTFALSWFAGVIAYFAAIGVYIAMIGPMLEAGNTAPTMNMEMILKLYLAMLVFFVLYGFFSLPYHAALLRRKVAILGLGELRFSLRADMFSLGWIYLVNMFILIFTLGLGLPIAQMRVWRYVFRRLEAEGQIDIDAIKQTADRGPKSGEGLADAFDIGNVI